MRSLLLFCCCCCQSKTLENICCCIFALSPFAVYLAQPSLALSLANSLSTSPYHAAFVLSLSTHSTGSLHLRHRQTQQRWREYLTTTANATWRLRGPVSHWGAGEDGGSLSQVTRITGILQHCAHRERTPVGFCQVDPAVLDHVWPHTSWEERANIRN